MQSAAPDLPEGDVTFLLTDVVGSTALLERIGAERYRSLRAAHHRLLLDVLAEHGGVCFKNAGDGLMTAFVAPGPAVRAAAAMQRALAGHSWSPEQPPAVRMALHRGEALVESGDYVSLALHRAVRLLAGPHGGQAVCSAEVAEGGPDVVLLGAYWVRDFPDAVPIYQVGGATDDFAPLALPRADLTNVSATGVDLVGRDAELSAIGAALADSRLVTLTGPGGVGKTSLASEVARRLAAAGEAAWQIEFAPVEVGVDDPPDVIAQRLVSAVGRAIGTPTEAKPAVLARLASRAVTLVLDNCEHLLDPAAELVAEILTACPQVRLLVTSREALRLPDETVVEVPPLGLPEPEMGVAELLDCASVALFERYARKGNPAFRITPDNAAAVGALCRGVDGLPLALELAGTSTRYLSPSDMLARLTSVGSLPVRSSARRSARHDSLDAVVRWSLSTCTDEQITVFRRLGAFAGPSAPDAVVAVCGQGGLDADTVLDAIGALIDKSLVVLRTDGDRTRYDMLVTMRRAAVRLGTEAGELDRTMLAHARWVIARVVELESADEAAKRTAEPDLVPEATLVLDRADRIGLPVAEQVQLVSSPVLRLGIRVPGFSDRTAVALLQREGLTPSQRSHLLSTRLRTWAVGAPDRADLHRLAAEAAREAGEPRDLIFALLSSPASASGQLDVADARAALSPQIVEVGEIVQAIGYRHDVEIVYRTGLGVEYTQLGDLEAARTEHRRALDLATGAKDTFNEGIALYNIAEVDELDGDDLAALHGYGLAADRFRADEFHLQHAFATLANALLCERTGDPARARDWAADAVLAARRSGNRGLLGQCLMVSARVAAATGDLPLAVAAAGEVLELDPSGPHAPDARAIFTAAPQAGVRAVS